MSLEEKVNQLLQLPGYCYEDSVSTGPITDLGLTKDSLYQAGSCLSVIGAKKLKQIQDQCLKEQPHHIPMLFMCDIINGYRTVFPIPLAQGATFDPELIHDCAAMAAAESAAAGLHVVFSPMTDLVRDARWGRVMESTGEDTYLNCVMARETVKGYQGDDIAQKGKVAACLKHFAGYGAPTAGRDYNNVELSERTFREDYLPAYQAAVDAKCALVMTSFNSNNRVPSSGSKELLRDILRQEMGFDGVVISDWAAILELKIQGIAADDREAAKLAIEAGVDIDMVTNLYVSQLPKLVAEQAVDMSLVDDAVMRVLTLKNKLGLFENPYKDADEAAEKELLLCESHRQLAKKCAAESFVLLKNEGILPLSIDREKLAFIGPYVDEKKISGSWSIFSEDEDSITIKEAVEKKLGQGIVSFEKGCEIINAGQLVYGFRAQYENTLSQTEAAENLQRAVTLAKESGVVVMALGEHREFTGEAASSAFLTIPEIQMDLLRKVYEVNQNIVVVLFNGRPLDLREIEGMAKAILEVWMPGTEGGTAIAEVLFGDQNPSGKLSMSFPYCVGQVPVFYNEFNTGRPFKGDYRTTRFASKYMDIPNEPLYPFGYGLSYTEFTYSGVTLSSNKMYKEDTIDASITLTNSGTREGTEVVQCYIQDVAGSVIRPVRQLGAFQRSTLKPGESRTVQFNITNDMLKFYRIDMQFDSEPGIFKVYIGGDSRTMNEGEFELL
jgi:beta-glucosidase